MVIAWIIVGIIAGMAVQSGLSQRKVITLEDTYFPNKNRSTTQQACDDVMQLQNEIAQSGAIVRKELEGGSVQLTLKVVK